MKKNENTSNVARNANIRYEKYGWE